MLIYVYYCLNERFHEKREPPRKQKSTIVTHVNFDSVCLLDVIYTKEKSDNRRKLILQAKGEFIDFDARHKQIHYAKTHLLSF